MKRAPAPRARAPSAPSCTRARTSRGSARPGARWRGLRSRSGGSVHRHDVEPVVEVLAELALPDRLLEIAVRGRDARACRPARRARRRGARTPRPGAPGAAWPGAPGSSPPISSRKIVPPFANSNLPSLRFCAPVNAPFSKPNSSLSSSSEGSAAQLTFTNGLSWRLERRWSVRATSSLPVPLSPRIRTVMSVSATCSIDLAHVRIRPSSAAVDRRSCSERGRPAAQLLDLAAQRAVLERRLEGELELLHLEGLAQEVAAPSCIASTMVRAWPWPESITTGTSGIRFFSGAASRGRPCPRGRRRA